MHLEELKTDNLRKAYHLHCHHCNYKSAALWSSNSSSLFIREPHSYTEHVQGCLT